MALIKKNELKQLSQLRIEEQMKEFKKELIKLNSQRAVGSAIENPGRIRLLKRTIAKLMTVKNQQTKNTLKEGKKS